MGQQEGAKSLLTASIRRYSFAYLCVAIFSFLLIYIASEYFQTARLSQLVSFQAWDAPGPLPENLYPNAFGNHFFGDFLIIFRLSQQDSPYFAPGIVPFFYFPLSAVFLGPLVLFDYWVALALFMLFGLCGFFLVCWHGLSHLDRHSRKVIIALVLFSGPMFSAIDRGNLALILALVSIAGVLQIYKGRNYRAAVLLGIAGAMKGYPILYLLIFVRRRQWKEFSAGVVSFILGIIIPLSFYNNGLLGNFKEMSSQFIGASNPQHATNIRAYNSSLLALLDTCRTSVVPYFSTSFQFLEDKYTIVGLIFTIILLVHSISKHASDFESLLLTTVVICLVPQTVGYYVLLLYFVPLLFLWANNESSDLRNKIVLAAIAIIMVPKGLPLWFPFGYWSPAAATYTSLLNPVCGLLIAFTCIKNISTRRLTARKLVTNSKDIHQDSRHTIDMSF